MAYPSFRWKYVCKRPKLTFIIYAREQKTADEIIAVENVRNIHYLKPARFFFKKAVMVKVPPYELEQSQLSAAEARLKRREAYLKEHPEDEAWLAKQVKHE